jgi:hypothetical protein
MSCPCGYVPGNGETEQSVYFIKNKAGVPEFVQVSCNGCNRSSVFHHTTAPEHLRKAIEWSHSRVRWTGIF